MLIEPRGTRRLSTQTLLDLRVSRVFRLSNAASLELTVDLLNVLNDTAEERIGTEIHAAATVGQGNIFIDPRSVMGASG